MLAEPVPLQLRNAPTQLMKDLHYGEATSMPMTPVKKLTHMECMPKSLAHQELLPAHRAG